MPEEDKINDWVEDEEILTESSSNYDEEVGSEIEPPKRKSSFFIVILFIIGFFVATFFWATNVATKPPANFPLDSTFTIEKGTGTWRAIQAAKQQGLIKYELALYFELRLNHSTNSIKAGTYTFSKPLSVSELAAELTLGNHKNDLIKITTIEGESSTLVATRLSKSLPEFDSQLFLEQAKPLEGKLFPDTYLVPKSFDEEELLNLLTTTFAEKIAPYEDQILNSKFSLDEIIILASILEREANTPESKKIVSGILQKRLSIDMPLQVDASIEYILDKPLSELTPEDLDIDSPYNTYLNYGLPPTPIGNPGLEAIVAVLEPEETNYLFYITGDDGNFYYGRNFDEHRLNIAKYLR